MEKFLKISSIFIIVIGIILIIFGTWGIYFTYQSIAQENIITPKDATISEKPVRGPFTLMAQVNVIRKHTLSTTEGKTFAEMPRQVKKLDEKGQPILDAENNPMMIDNPARNIWITATALTTALSLGILGYALSGLFILFGITLILLGVSINILIRRINY